MDCGAYLLSGAGGMLFYSKVGKLQLRERLLDKIPWRGDEFVLDIGCGRGLLTVGAVALDGRSGRPGCVAARRRDGQQAGCSSGECRKGRREGQSRGGAWRREGQSRGGAWRRAQLTLCR